MDYTPTPLETLFLWRLLASEGGEFLTDVKPDPTSAARRRLEQAGLTESTKRKKPILNRRGRCQTYISLTEAGWHWATEHLDAEVSSRSPAAGPILRAMMQKLKIHLADCPTSLADFITATGDEDHGPAPHSELVEQSNQGTNDPALQLDAPSDHVSMIRDACRQLRGTTPTGAIHLATLRDTLPNISRDRFNHALRELERSEQVVLYPIENPSELDSDDRIAATQ